MKSLVIYFSRAGENYAVGKIEKGNTEVIAEYIAEFTGAELFRCEPVKAYSADYATCCKEAMEYWKNGIYPDLKAYLDGIGGYDVIYIGGPIYFGEYPYEIYSQLRRLDFTGKTVKPFTTHEGSGLGKCVSALKERCRGAKIAEGLAVQGKTVYTEASREAVREWVKR